MSMLLVCMYVTTCIVIILFFLIRDKKRQFIAVQGS